MRLTRMTDCPWLPTGIPGGDLGTNTIGAAAFTCFLVIFEDDDNEAMVTATSHSQHKLETPCLHDNPALGNCH